MTDRERAIVMAYTGVCMLEGKKLDAFYQYLAELYGRPVYTHEWLTLDIKEKSRPDFIKLCEEEQPERKKGKWEKQRETYCSWNCSVCKEVVVAMPERMGYPLYDYCPNCGADMREEGDL